MKRGKMRRNYGHEPRQRLWPMPVEAIIDHPGLKNAPSVVYGAVMRLLHHFWACDCKPLPEATRELESIGRMTEHLWRNHGALIMEVVTDALPSLIQYYDARVTRKTNLKNLSMRAEGKRALQAQQRAETEVRRRMGHNQVQQVRESKRVRVAAPSLPPPTPTDGVRVMVDKF